MPPLAPPPNSKGILYAVLAYGGWGVIPLYWKLFGKVSPLEVVSHRMIWSLLLLIILIVALRLTGEAWAVLRNWRLTGALLATALLLSVNWGLYVYGVMTEQIVQTSLGYFLNPLVSILFGFVFLKERLTRWQVAAVALAACGVAHYGWHLGQPPWIALGLAVSFGLYGLIRKVVAASPLVGLLVETALMTPVALIIVHGLTTRGEAGFGASTHLTLLFMSAGVITTLPLMWFNSAAKMLPLSMMGFLQYLAPSLQLIIAVLVYKEPFTQREAVSFALIWVAVVIYMSTILRAKGPAVPVPNAD